MNRVKIKLVNNISLKLQLVKTIKVHSGMGLKESKELCDDMFVHLNHDFDIFVKDVLEFKNEIKSHFGDDIQIRDKEYERNLKLISLGLGDDFDRIKILSDFLSSEICTSINNKDIVNRRNIINSFFEDFLTNFNSEQIGDLFNKIVK